MYYPGAGIETDLDHSECIVQRKYLDSLVL